MNEVAFLTRSVVFVLVFVAIVSVMAVDNKEVDFAEEEWEDIEEALGGGTATQDAIDEASADDLPTPNPDEADSEEDPPWWTSIPVFGQAAQFTLDVGAAIWGGVLAFSAWVRSGFQVGAALFTIFLNLATFNVPALRGDPLLRVIFIAIASPFWIAIPYILVRVIRGGG